MNRCRMLWVCPFGPHPLPPPALQPFNAEEELMMVSGSTGDKPPSPAIRCLIPNVRSTVLMASLTDFGIWYPTPPDSRTTSVASLQGIMPRSEPLKTPTAEVNEK